MGVEPKVEPTAKRRLPPVFVIVVCALLLLAAVAAAIGGNSLRTPAPQAGDTDAPLSWRVRLEQELFSEEDLAKEGTETEDGEPLGPNRPAAFVGALGLAVACVVLAWGLWGLKSWARTGVTLLLGVTVLYFLMGILFEISADIFGGQQIVGFLDREVEGEQVRGIFSLLGAGLLRILAVAVVPAAMIYGLRRLEDRFVESLGQRKLVDGVVRWVLLITAFSSIFIIALIILFTVRESIIALQEVGFGTMVFGTVWRPGSILGQEEKAQLGLVPMILGSILSTAGAVMLGVPLSIGTAILLAEIAPHWVREIVRPMIELLAGIPSVVYGLFGMVVLAPLIRKIEIPYNTGFGLLNASIVLAVMIIPTVTSITEDAIRAVPRRYKEGSLAMGATHWQTIWNVILPAARSGIIAAIILGIGRALGETMALIMVIGNAIAIPKPLPDSNFMSIFLSAARTLTGNIAVEITYAPAGSAHRSALFFTGVLLFVMILAVNSIARFLMRERLSS